MKYTEIYYEIPIDIPDNKYHKEKLGLKIVLSDGEDVDKAFIALKDKVRQMAYGKGTETKTKDDKGIEVEDKQTQDDLPF